MVGTKHRRVTAGQDRGPVFRLLAWVLMFAVGGLVALLLCELVIMRALLAPSDMPRMAFENGVIKYRPHQSGVYRRGNEVEAPYRINDSGWNSGHATYSISSRDSRLRVLIAGDSFIEAFQVPFDASVAEELEKALGERRAAVFRMGMSGAPLSQYVQMLRREGVRYRPDLVIVNLVHNDFLESFRRQPGRYTRSFRLLRVREAKVVGEQPPQPWRPGWREWVGQLATIRYLYYRWGVTPRAVLRGMRSANAAQFEANVDVARVAEYETEVRNVTRALLQELVTLSREAGFRLLLLMDGDRGAIYKGHEVASRALELNAMVAHLAGELGIELLDLQQTFRQDFRRHGRRFEFDHDGHWNAYAHRRVAHALHPVVERLLGER